MTNSAKILIVDDEPMVRGLVEMVLKAGGYRVFSAESPECALDVVEDEPDFDLLVTDMLMPRMNGGALAEALSMRNPGLRVLFMSGFQPDLSHSRTFALTESSFLRKPFLLPELLAKVRGMLN